MKTDASHHHPPSSSRMYARLARREERDVLAEFGNGYALYAEKTPEFVPRIFGRRPADRNSVYGKHRL